MIVVNPEKYEFKFVGGRFNSYLFETKAGFYYEVIFKPSDYLFEGNEIFRDKTYEFSILLNDGPEGKLPPLDDRIPFTIASIFKDFYKLKTDRIIIYICDTADMRAKARYRKFNHWFETYRGFEFFKTDYQMGADEKGNIYLTSIILSTKNPNAQYVAGEYIKLLQKYDK